MSKTSIALLLMFFVAVAILLSLNSLYATNTVFQSFPGIFPTQTIVTAENTLSLLPDVVKTTAGKKATIQVTIDSHGKKPDLIQLELAYDPGALTTVHITPGTFFQNPRVTLTNVNARNGRISYAISPSKGDEMASSSTVVATITFIPTGFQRETTLYFLPKTVVRTKEIPNTLKTAYGTKIIILPGAFPFASSSAHLNY